MQQGARYGYREHPKRLGEPLQQVEVVTEPPKRFRQVRIRYLSGDLAGLEEWVPKIRLLVPWDDAQTFIVDETSKKALLDAVGLDMSTTIPYEAIETVLASVSWNDSLMMGWKTSETNLLRIVDFEVTTKRLDLPIERLLSFPNAFVDRHHIYWGPYSAAEDLAKWLCSRVPQLVLGAMLKDQARLQLRAVRGLNDEMRAQAEAWLVEKAPLYSLVREWCGEESTQQFEEIRALQEEIARLRRLIERTAQAMRREGLQQEAEKLLGSLHREGTKDVPIGLRPETETELWERREREAWRDRIPADHFTTDLGSQDRKPQWGAKRSADHQKRQWPH